ncbi:hypothetical protein TNCV_5140861 [Trichonephila clavipes]|nr:hypothetical protein TNCV_5140861 [Trichonephila clavipes]
MPAMIRYPDHWATAAPGGQSEAKPSVFKSPNKLGTHLSIHYSRDERLSGPFPAREWNLDLWCGSAIRYHSITGLPISIYMVSTSPRIVADMVAINYAELALSPIFQPVSIESPL